MHIVAQTGTPISLPLETAFTIDFAALLPEGATMTGLVLYALFGGGDAFTPLEKVSDTVYAYMPDHRETGFRADTMNPEAPVGRFLIFNTGEDTIQVDAYNAASQLGAEPALKGTSGGDDLVHDAADPDGITLNIVDTSGGSDRAQITNGAGILLGRSGDDTLTGWDLNDALYGGGGLDALYGGAGNDRLLGMNGDDRIFGGTGRDLLSGGDGDDVLTGGTDDDTLAAGTGNDTLRGEDGADILQLTRRLGNISTRPIETILAFGGDGNDSFSTVNEDSSVGILRPGDVGIVDLYGGAGDDNMHIIDVTGGSLYGGKGNDQIGAGRRAGATDGVFLYGGAGNDRLYGGLGADAHGGIGNDYVLILKGSKGIGGDGNDEMHISDHPNTDTNPGLGGELYGGEGDDTLRGANLDDRLFGENGNDTLFGGDGNDYLHGGDGNDLLTAGSGNDILVNGLGDNTLRGEAGDDRFDLVEILTNRSFYPSEDVPKTLAYGGQDNDRFVAGPSIGYGEYATHGFATLYGGDGNDTFILTGLENGFIYGGNGNDIIEAAHRMYAAGRLQLFGGSGNDILNSTQNGSQGSTEAKAGDGDDVVTIGNGQTGWGEEGNDMLVVNSGASLSSPQKGGLLYGGIGSDTLNGGTLNDILHGGGNSDALFGGDGDDRLFGDLEHDALFGGNGIDFLNGGAGTNMLTGGDGADLFAFDKVTGMSVVTDFTEGIDKLVFRAQPLGRVPILGIGDGDATIDTMVTIDTLGQRWNSNDEIVFFAQPLLSNSHRRVADALNAEPGSETIGERQLVVVNNGIDSAVYLHIADGILGVLEKDLSLLAVINGNGTLNVDDFGFF